MSNICDITREFNSVKITQRASDGYLDATAMCKATGKLFADYRRLKASQEFIEALSSKSGCPVSQLIESQKGNTAKFEQGTWVHPLVFEDLMLWIFHTGTSTRKVSIEKRIRDRLHDELGGDIEVSTPIGKIDLLTDSELIEVKNIRKWKAAVGQVMVYGAYYPKHSKRIHLFGKAHSDLIALVIKHCTQLGITVTLENNLNCD